MRNTLYHAYQPQNVASDPANQRYIELNNARLTRLNWIGHLAPHTGHKVGHKYPPR